MSFGGYAAPAANPMSTLTVRVSAKDLTKMDTFSKSDPMCIVYLKSQETGNQYREIGRTERIKDTHDPSFAKSFEVPYFFEEVQMLKFDMYDSDAKAGAGALSQHDYIGGCEATIGTIVGASAGKYVADLKRPSGTKVHGKLHVVAEEHSGVKGKVIMQFRGTGLDKKDFFGKSDPFYEIFLADASGSHTMVFRSQHIMKTLNPTWSPMTISLTNLCNGDRDRPLLFKVYDWDSDGSHDLIGTCNTTLNEMASEGLGNEWDLINPKKIPGGKKAKKGYKNSGVLSLLSIAIEEEKGFVEYLAAGLQLNFSVAIDFTASNGAANQPTSLHYMNPYQPNPYASAIKAVGEVIRDYDNDKLFPTVGYGARLPAGSTAPVDARGCSHCFSITGDEANPFCHGIEGIIAMYQQTIPRVEFYGPTYFEPIIQKTAEFAAQAHSSEHKGTVYYVMLIITDGEIHDMPKVKNAIVAASHLPMSIIIVGVGNADFTNMQILDGDGEILKDSRGQRAERDIVQFVPLNTFQGNQQALAREVLAEIPAQVTAYMSKHGGQ